MSQRGGASGVVRNGLACAAALVALGVAQAALANDVLAGHDLWATPPGGAVNDYGNTDPQVPGDVPPLPMGFFYPGSLPFTGVVEFVGNPPGTFLGQPTGAADTIVERQGNAALPDPPPQTDTIPIEIVELSLVSVSPITVTPGPTLWDVEVDLSGFAPSTGTMTIRHNDAFGGDYDAQLDVCPLLTFRETGPPFRVQIQDYCLDVNPAGQAIAVNGQPWSHTAQPLVSPLSGPNFFVIGQTNHSGPHPVADPIEEAIVQSTPALGLWGRVLLVLLVVTAAAVAMLRFSPGARIAAR